MHYELKAMLVAPTVFNDDGFIAKKKEYSYSEIVDFKIVAPPTGLTNGVFMITLKNGKSINCGYDKKHKEDADAVIKYLESILSNHADDSKKLEKAKELYYYCANNNYGKGFNEKLGIQHFKTLVDSLMPEEEVIFPFIGIHNYTSMTNHDNNYAYAVTNKRIIMGQKKIVGQTVQSVSWKNINDITFSTGMLFGVITIDTYKETFNVAIDKSIATSIYTRIQEVFEDVRNQENTGSKQSTIKEDPYEALKKLKELLDMGIITQEEFDAKKKKMLDL